MVCMVQYKKNRKCLVKNAIYLAVSVFFCIFLHSMFLKDMVQFVENMGAVAKFVKRHTVISGSTDIKYILVWPNNAIIDLENGKHSISRLKCKTPKCIFTDNKDLLNDYSSFHAIIFSEADLNIREGRPTKRASEQIYIFNSLESSATKPACELYNDDFFNWTFTHRLDSDVVWTYFVVRNASRAIVAPSTTVAWKIPRYPINTRIKAIFRGRSKVAAWLVSNCLADSLRQDYLTSLQEHLFHYSLQIDVYGECTQRKCDHGDCETMIRTKYYFYMAFENSFADDYVTEKVLHGYDNYVVPIVYGGANYTRFLPPGSYIDARMHHPYVLAKLMYHAINNPKIYEEYFRWTNFYTIESIESKKKHPLCDLCDALNSERAKHAPVKKNFRIWWNTLKGMKWCLPLEFWNETSKLNVDLHFAYNNNI